MNEVWVFIEQDVDVSLELLSKASELAKKLQTKVAAIILGDQVAELEKKIIAYGADIIYVVEHESLKIYQTLPFARNIVALAKKYHPEVFLIGATLIGRDLAPRISAGLKCGLTADCTHLDIQDVNYRKKDYKNLLLQTRPAFGGNIIATIISPDTRPQMATVREGVMTIGASDYNRTGVIIRENFIASEQDSLIQILERAQNCKTVNLKDSNIIVTVGGGVNNQDCFKLVQQLATTLGAQLGASRVAVEKGVISRDHQVGQTGITVRPEIYIACGVSGAIQHRTGMDQSKIIIAFNKDPNAAIMKTADYAIVGDLKQTIPLFLDAYRRKMSR